MRFLLLILGLSLLATPSWAQRSSVSAPDPFIINDSMQPVCTNTRCVGYQTTAGLTMDNSIPVSSPNKTLVVIAAGQSLNINISPTTYTTVNTTKIRQLNIYDGALYRMGGKVLGSTDASFLTGYGGGNLSAYYADGLINSGRWNNVIIANVSVGSSSVSDWATGLLRDRICQVMGRLARRGITPATSGVSFAIDWAQGESDTATSQAAYTAALNAIYSNAVSCGFSGKMFVALETAPSDTTSGTYLAQMAWPNGSDRFQGRNINSLTGTNRMLDGVHLSDLGNSNASVLTVNAFAAAGY